MLAIKVEGSTSAQLAFVMPFEKIDIVQDAKYYAYLAS
jgi:hypothetical protein